MEKIPSFEQSSDVCKHRTPKSEHCDSCALESQPAWRTVQSLAKKSKFKRSDLNGPECSLEIGRQKFKIETVELREDPRLSEVQELFEKTFGKEEVDPEEILRSAVAGKTPWNTEDVPYRIITVRDDQDKLASAIAGAQLDLYREDGTPTNQSVFFVGYAVTSPDVRQGGLAREAYTSALLDAMQTAQERNVELKFAIGECTWTSEKFWNSVGWKRIYLEQGNKQRYQEIRYIQPALDFDPKTGAIAEGAGEVPEHIMIDGFGPHTPSKEDVFAAYNAFMDYNVSWPAEAFESAEAHTTQMRYVASLKEHFRNEMFREGQLIYLDAKNREKARKQGIIINDHAEADHGNAGREDF